MNISQQGLTFISRMEGCKLQIYKDSAGLPTIGIGHLIKSGEDFSKGITYPQALALLASDSSIAASAVNNYVKVILNQEEFDALVSFTFNIGVNAFDNSTLLKLLNTGNRHMAADQFLVWNHAGGKTSSGLTARRVAERDLFLNGIYK